MIRQIKIANFKSIVEDTIELGRINVFIGENGAGKTNILEAVAMLAAAVKGRLGAEELLTRGIRITRPKTMSSAFAGQKPPHDDDLATQVRLEFVEDAPGKELKLGYFFQPSDPTGISGSWESIVDSSTMAVMLRNDVEDLVKPRKLEELPGWLVAASLLIVLAKRWSNGPDGLPFGEFGIYSAETSALRGLAALSKREPLGLHGENLDVFLSFLKASEPENYDALLGQAHIISWLDDLVFDEGDILKGQGHKLGRSTSRLYFKDKFLSEDDSIFSAENANEGILHVLFYLALFASNRSPAIFGIDNIETALNPRLCTLLMEHLATLAKKHDKQALITTHNPAILDGMNLNDDDERLFVVYRDDDGHTKTRRIKLKPTPDGKQMKLSELWMRGHLGAIPTGF